MRERNSDLEVRCFVAAMLDPVLREAVVSGIAPLRSAGASVKWVEPENLHFTLKFLGGIPLPRVEAAKRGIARAVAGRARFGISLRGAGVFPAGGPPRVVWVGLGDGERPLAELARAIEEDLGRERFPREKRGFTPHLTVGRARDLARATSLREAVERLRDAEFGSMIVERVSLMSSHLTPQGPVYSALEEWALA